MSDYRKLRDALKKCEKRVNGTCKCDNEVTCAKRIIEKYMQGDKDKLLILKAQARNLDSKHSSDAFTSDAAMAISIVVMFVNIVLDFDENSADKLNVLMMYIFMIVAIFLLAMIVRNSLRKLSVWNDYMNVAIEELEKE